MTCPTVLISGGAGYVGAHVNKCLTRRGYKTIVLDDLDRGHSDLVRWGKLIEGRAGNKKLLNKIFMQYSVTDVVHLAGYAYVGESVENPTEYWSNNCCESLSLLQECVTHGVKRFIFSSTCTTYGHPERVPIHEEHRQKPINPYGTSKLAVEWMLKDISAASDLNYFNLRYFNAAGADPEGEIGERHSPETHLIPNVLRAAYHDGGEVHVFGEDYNTPDGTCIRDYVHVSDLADAHARALEYLIEGGSSESCNLGLGRGYSVAEVIDSVQRVTGKRIRRVSMPRRVGDPPILIADARRAKKLLGWEPKHKDLDSIVWTAWCWHQKDWHERSK